MDIDDQKSYNITLEDVETRLRELKTYKMEYMATKILVGLGFNINDIANKDSTTFSGGWRMRLKLACALFNKPDFLILDEPTNHLDINAVIWLEYYLSKYNQGLLIVSHDIGFLNEIIDNVISFSDKNLKYYKGNYDSYLKQLKLEQQTADNEARKNKKKKNKKVKNLPTEKPVHITLNPVETLTETAIIKIQNVSFSYIDKSMFKDLDLGIYMDSRIGFIGPNGSGKSTLLKLIRGKLLETAGHIWRNNDLRISYFDQHHIDKFKDLDQTPIDFMIKTHNISSPHDARCYLA
jgi:ATPase subunit of ABC transporter with duplicated ATPase domains